MRGIVDTPCADNMFKEVFLEEFMLWKPLFHQPMFLKPVHGVWWTAALRKFKRISPFRWVNPFNQLTQTIISSIISFPDYLLIKTGCLPITLDSMASVWSFRFPHFSSILWSISSSFSAHSICSICEETVISSSMSSLCSTFSVIYRTEHQMLSNSWSLRRGFSSK